MPAHKRIRKFNTRDTYPNQALDNDLCQAVVAGNTVYLRGQVGTDFDGNLVGLGDPGAQAEQAMKNVKQLLEEAGSELGHICKITIYLLDKAHRDDLTMRLLSGMSDTALAGATLAAQQLNAIRARIQRVADPELGLDVDGPVNLEICRRALAARNT